MRLCFTIRDLLWLALVVALATGWWLDHRRLAIFQEDRQVFINVDSINFKLPGTSQDHDH
jgi:hypothetical protein